MKEVLAFALIVMLLLCGVALAEAGEASCEIGSVYVFGAYEQDNNLTNGKEPIEWIIIGKRDDGGLVLMSKFALDATAYNTYRTDVTWETCTLRAWLNEDFYETAFSPDEKTKIAWVMIENEDNPIHATAGGRPTQDKVWLLSISEAVDLVVTDRVYSYFTDDDLRMCAPTDYAIARHAYQSIAYTVDGIGSCYWWLRSPGDSSEDAAYIDTGGSVYTYGNFVSSNVIAVRPVICVLP